MSEVDVSGVRLGCFALGEHIGRGGMADVYAGRHLEQGVDVAIKVVAESHLGDPDFLEAFRREVHAVAGLDHPSVVTLFDAGAVDGQASRASGGLLVEGAPYFVMRRASHGTLGDLPGPLPWEGLPAVLCRLLAGLAHAHARGVIHRDLKPANVLVHREGQEQQLWLSDFGIAHRASGSMHSDAFERGAIVGTPGFMAPEQLLARWREYGPWTDLYSLGALTWALLTGHEPFDTLGKTPQQAIFQRLEAEFPPLPDGLAPPAVAEWIGRLTRKDPALRYRRAADALADLPGDTTRPVSLPLSMGEGGDEATTWAAPPSTPRPVSVPPVGEGGGGRIPSRRPSVAPSWRRPTRRPAEMALLGAGLGLHGVREVPVAGRLAERDALWAALSQVVSTARPRLIVIRGASGLGKTRLATWLSRRAHELGIADILRASHERHVADEALTRMLVEKLVLGGASFERAEARLKHELGRWGIEDRYTLAAAASLVAPAFPDGRARLGFAGVHERYEVLATLLEAMARERPLLMVADDLQWGAETLGFIQHLLRRPGPLPMLVVATVQLEALVDSPGVSTALTRLAGHERVEELVLAPLSPEEEERFVCGLLRLDERLAREVSLRCHGHPQYAMQVVGDLIHRGALKASPRGFGLASGLTLALPESLKGVWRARLDAFVGDAEADRRALWAAAAFGRRVSVERWRSACVELGLSPSQDLVARLERDGLIEPSSDALVLVHAALRDALLADASRSAALVEVREACARAVAAEPGSDEGTELLGRLFVELDRHADAAPRLRQAALRRVERSEYTLAHELLDRHEQCLAQLMGDAEGRERAEAWTLRARLLRLTGRFRAAERLAARAADLARRLGDDRVLSEATSRLGEVALRRGRLPQASAALDEARAIMPASADLTARLIVEWNLAWVALLRGETAVARASFSSTWALAERDPALAPRLLHHLWSWAFTALAELDLSTAAERAEQALMLARAQGNRLVVAHALQVLASGALMRGDPAGAARTAADALAHYDEVGSPERHFADLTLHRAHLELDTPGEAALAVADGVSRHREERPMVALRYLGLAARLALAAGDEPGAREALRELAELSASTEIADVFVARDLLLAKAERGVGAELAAPLVEHHIGCLGVAAGRAARAAWSAGLRGLTG